MRHDSPRPVWAAILGRSSAGRRHRRPLLSHRRHVVHYADGHRAVLHHDGRHDVLARPDVDSAGRRLGSHAASAAGIPLFALDSWLAAAARVHAELFSRHHDRAGHLAAGVYGEKRECRAFRRRRCGHLLRALWDLRCVDRNGGESAVAAACGSEHSLRKCRPHHTARRNSRHCGRGGTRGDDVNSQCNLDGSRDDIRRRPVAQAGRKADTACRSRQHPGNGRARTRVLFGSRRCIQATDRCLRFIGRLVARANRGRHLLESIDYDCSHCQHGCQCGCHDLLSRQRRARCQFAYFLWPGVQSARILHCQHAERSSRRFGRAGTRVEQ